MKPVQLFRKIETKSIEEFPNQIYVMEMIIEMTRERTLFYLAKLTVAAT